MVIKIKSQKESPKVLDFHLKNKDNISWEIAKVINFKTLPTNNLSAFITIKININREKVMS